MGRGTSLEEELFVAGYIRKDSATSAYATLSMVDLATGNIDFHRGYTLPSYVDNNYTHDSVDFYLYMSNYYYFSVCMNYRGT